MAQPDIQGMFIQLEQLRMGVTCGDSEIFDEARALAIETHAVSELSGQSRRRTPRSDLHVMSVIARRQAEQWADGDPNAYLVLGD